MFPMVFYHVQGTDYISVNIDFRSINYILLMISARTSIYSDAFLTIVVGGEEIVVVAAISIGNREADSGKRVTQAIVWEIAEKLCVVLPTASPHETFIENVFGSRRSSCSNTR